MKKIASAVYENLTPRQRVIAAIEAESRQDQFERMRLIRTCPKVNYISTDERFSATIEKLFALAMAVEADLRECVIGFLIAVRYDPKNSRRFLQNFADIRESWKSTILNMGIDEKSMALAGPGQLAPLTDPVHPRDLLATTSLQARSSALHALKNDVRFRYLTSLAPVAQLDRAAVS